MLVAGCSPGAAGHAVTQAALTTGDRKPLGAGTAFTWAQTDANGAPAAIGLSFDDAALTNLGSTPTETVLALPATPVSSARTVVIDWNPQGHPPAHVYDVPHFDFHFYTIDETTRMAIAPNGPAAQATPAPDLVPAGFITDGSTVPMMGKHYFPASQPEFHGGSFTATPIYGYWDGHLAFFESMVTVAYLQTHPSLSQPLPQPARFERSGWYPTQWGVSYDAAAHRYDITFSQLAAH